MDWKIIGTLGGLVLTLALSMAGGAWWIASSIHDVDSRLTSHMLGIKDDIAELKAEVGYIKGRLDPIKFAE
ncbi:hypothetical protein [Thioalkalivibrio sp. HK1]|uniref:hypothetical protein n=1 Tax=Thioalkalivibrio sp. HK1 TaxID=1469245 RepID=UPI00046E5C56|nr:hypothetical protein [Thioalkalivibrio sp. HK1]